MKQKSKIQKIEKMFGIGTFWNFEFYEEVDLKEVELEVKKIFSVFENNYSRFRKTSPIELLNANKELLNPSEEMVDLLEKGKRLYKETDGFFNITLGKVLSDLGYNKDYSFTPKDINYELPELDKNLSISDKLIKLSGSASIDIGGLGKGYLVDKIFDFFAGQLNLSYFLINGGGDIFATSDNGSPIELLLQDPTLEDKFLYKVKIKDRALCTSSPFKRSWRDKKSDKVYSHIISPESKTFNEQVHVVAKKAYAADAFATAILAGYSPSEKVPDIVREQDIGYLIISSNGSILQEYNFPDIEK